MQDRSQPAHGVWLHPSIDAAQSRRVAPKLLLPIDLDHDAEGQASQWLREAVWREWSLEEIQTFEDGLSLAGVDLSGAVRKHRSRLNAMAGQLESILREVRRSSAVVDVVRAVSVPEFDILAELASEIRKVPAAVRSLRNFARAALALRLPEPLVVAIDDVVSRRLHTLEATRSLGQTLDLKRALRAKQGPHLALPIVRLADLLIERGFSERKAFAETARLLRSFDDSRYADLRPDHVRHRYKAYRSRRSD